MNFEEMVQRAVNAKAKAGLKSSTMVRDLDIHCPRGHCSSNSNASKVQTQKTTAKDFLCPKKPKVKETKSIRASAVELSEPAKTEDKQKRFEH